jgi:hypothetical protein
VIVVGSVWGAVYLEARRCLDVANIDKSRFATIIGIG